MENQLKLLMTPDDLHNLQKTAINLRKYIDNVLEPLKNTFANEGKRAINYNRRVEVAIREGEKIILQIKATLSEKTP